MCLVMLKLGVVPRNYLALDLGNRKVFSHTVQSLWNSSPEELATNTSLVFKEISKIHRLVENSIKVFSQMRYR